MTEIEDVSLAVAKGNKISALTMLRQAEFASDAEPYRQQTEMYILNDDLKLAQKCLDIAAIKTTHPLVNENCDERALMSATSLVEKTTEEFSNGQCDEQDLDAAVDYLYECLIDLAREQRGLK